MRQSSKLVHRRFDGDHFHELDCGCLASRDVTRRPRQPPIPKVYIKLRVRFEENVLQHVVSNAHSAPVSVPAKISTFFLPSSYASDDLGR